MPCQADGGGVCPDPGCVQGELIGRGVQVVGPDHCCQVEVSAKDLQMIWEGEQNILPASSPHTGWC